MRFGNIWSILQVHRMNGFASPKHYLSLDLFSSNQSSPGLQVSFSYCIVFCPAIKETRKSQIKALEFTDRRLIQPFLQTSQNVSEVPTKMCQSVHLRKQKRKQWSVWLGILRFYTFRQEFFISLCSADVPAAQRSITQSLSHVDEYTFLRPCNHSPRSWSSENQIGQ